MLKQALQLNLRPQDTVHGDGYKTHSRSRFHDISNVIQLWFLEHQMGQRYILDEDLEKPMVQSMAWQAQHPKKGFAKNPICCMVLSTYCSVRFSVHVKVSLKGLQLKMQHNQYFLCSIHIKLVSASQTALDEMHLLNTG